MKFSPITEQQAKESKAKFQPFPPGQYDFEVNKAEDKVSREKGNPMLHLELICYNAQGHKRFVHCYITEKMDFLLRHFAYSVGLGIAYEQGELEASDCTGRSGKVALRIEKQDGYDPKNSVQDFVVPEQYQDQKDAVEAAVLSQGGAPRAARTPYPGNVPAAASGGGGMLDESDIPFHHNFDPCYI